MEGDLPEEFITDEEGIETENPAFNQIQISQSPVDDASPKTCNGFECPEPEVNYDYEYFGSADVNNGNDNNQNNRNNGGQNNRNNGGQNNRNGNRNGAGQNNRNNNFNNNNGGGGSVSTTSNRNNNANTATNKTVA